MDIQWILIYCCESLKITQIIFYKIELPCTFDLIYRKWIFKLNSEYQSSVEYVIFDMIVIIFRKLKRTNHYKDYKSILLVWKVIIIKEHLITKTSPIGKTYREVPISRGSEAKTTSSNSARLSWRWSHRVLWWFVIRGLPFLKPKNLTNTEVRRTIDVLYHSFSKSNSLLSCHIKTKTPGPGPWC